MTTSALDELALLTRALKAHVEWSQACGAAGLPPSDESWLEARREHYRRTPYSGPEPTFQVDAAAVSTRDPHPEPSLPHPEAETTLSEFGGNDPPLGASEPRVPHPRATTDARTDDARPARGAEGSAESPVRLAVPRVTGVEVNEVVRRISLGEASAPAGEATPGLPAVTSGADLDWPERHRRLALLEQAVSQCRTCGLCEERTNTVFARGDGTVGVAFVGEGPGADEDAQGLPFVGAAGQLLDKMIAAMGLSRDAVYVCNIVKCRPPKNRKPTEEEMAACRHYVVSQLELVQPRVIVAMGATAVEGLLGVKLGITRLRGTWRLYKGTTPVMPTFHPAYLLRQPDAKRQVWEDLQAVLSRLNMPIPQRRK